MESEALCLPPWTLFCFYVQKSVLISLLMYLSSSWSPVTELQIPYRDTGPHLLRLVSLMPIKEKR